MNAEILIVDDSQDDCDLMVRGLKKADQSLDVMTCARPEEALERLFDESRNLPRVVLLDLRLAPGDGHEVLRRIRENPRTRPLPVVVVSGSRDGNELTRSYELGANSFVRKPDRGEELGELMATVGRYWTRLNSFMPDGPSQAVSAD